MASNTVSSTLQAREYHCKVCDLYLDTVESLEVHLQYHKENLYVKWGTQSAQNDNENNNSSKVKIDATVSAAADSSDNMITKPSPEFQQRGTPETSAQFPHPATPQSYHSAPSPYQNPDQTNFSPGAQFGTNTQYPPHSAFAQNQHSEQINWDQAPFNQDYHKSNRFHPYGAPERVPQVSSSSPLYGQPLNQPTPSPSPNQCDKCGFVCESAIQLNEHCNSAHASSASSSGSSMSYQQFTPKHYNTGFSNETPKVKEEQEESSDILDLDSQKVVYQGNDGDQPTANYDATQTSVREVNTRTVPMMSWDTKTMYNNTPMNGDVSMFKDQKIYPDQKAFHTDQKFAFGQDKFINPHIDQKQYNMTSEQKLYSGVHMSPLGEYPGGMSSGNNDMKPPYRPYDSPAVPQITSTQPANSTSSSLPPIGGKGANWKSNEARRPKTYNCTACNKWFTSSGHLKRHYNTTLHKNAVRSSGQPDPATMPISNHHHPAREPLSSRAQQQPADSNTQSPAPSDESRAADDVSLHSPYAASGFERSHRPTSMQSKSPYSHLQQGNIDNNFMSNNPLANHPLPHQVGTHPLNINSQPPGVGIPDGSQSSKVMTTSSSGIPPNGEAGPSVTQNHHLRGLLSVSTSNITTPALTQDTVAHSAHTLPPFSHLAVNPYSPRSTDPLAPSAPDPTHTHIYLGQNFQQTIVPNYPNGMAPHVMDMAISNLHIANPATFGEPSPEDAVTESEMYDDTANGRLPSFSQLQTQRFGVYIPNYITTPNVGGQMIPDESTAGYLIIDPTNSPIQYSTVDVHTYKTEYEEQKLENNGFNSEMYKMSPFNYIKSIKQENNFTEALEHANKENYESESQSSMSPIKNSQMDYNDANPISESQNSSSLDSETKLSQYPCPEGAKAIKRDVVVMNDSEILIIKIEDMMDYANKENEMQLPASPESAKAEYESNGSPSITSTVPGTPLVENNHIGKLSPSYGSGSVSGSGGVLHKCFECDKVFNKACYLTQHNKTFHSGAKPFKCKRCGKRFSDDAACEDHYSKHTENKPFKCTQCPKSFNHKTDLRRHMCLHSGTKPFPCNSCGKGFIRKDHMLKHCETHRKGNIRASANITTQPAAPAPRKARAN